jgi:FkbM family methyltransferase
MPQTNLIFDMGLHKGEDTDFYLRKGFDVVAFEANPTLIADCKRRFPDYVANGRLRIVEGAIAPRSAGPTVEFYQNAKVSVWGTIDADWAKRNDAIGSPSTIISVKRVDVSEIFKNIGIPFYLKIDLEGVDGLVLQALSEFEDRPQYLSVESEKVDRSALGQNMNTLARLGYTKFKIVQQAGIPGSSGSFQSLDGSVFPYTFLQDASGPFGEDIPQPWISLPDALKEYNAIFRRYRYFGDNTLFDRLPSSLRRLIEIGYKLGSDYRGALPGWHDTHASL